jgi:DNA-binding NtrC family response regulator
VEMIVTELDLGVARLRQAAVPPPQLASLSKEDVADPRHRTPWAAAGVVVRSLLALAARMARVDVSVLIRGESRTGKAMVARAADFNSEVISRQSEQH